MQLWLYNRPVEEQHARIGAGGHVGVKFVNPNPGESCGTSEEGRNMNSTQQTSPWIAALTLAFSLTALIAGCGGVGGGGGNTPNKGTVGGLPVPPAPTQINDHTGTASPGDVWNMHIDHTGSTFTAQDKTSGALAINGSFTTTAGFLGFSVGGAPSGYGLEILSRAALARVGDTTRDLIVLAQTRSGTCLSLNGTVNFAFVTVPNSAWSATSDVAYGSVSAATSGTTWNFTNLTQSTLAGSPASVGATLSPGTCNNSVITIPPSPTITSTVTVAVGPSGVFVADEGPTNRGLAGVLVPSGPINTGSLVAGNYLGFLTEPGAAAKTQIVSFGGGSSVSMSGGAFTNDDPTQAHATNITINFGTQDSTINGLYKAASVTIGANPSFPAVVVVGNPENKFAIFLIAQDTVNLRPMALYLFQQ